MSTWTHVAGIVRADDYSAIFSGTKTDLSKIFIKNTWYHRNNKGNLPEGSEGSIDVEFIERHDDESSDYMKSIAFFGDLRDFNESDCQKIKDWWFEIPDMLGKQFGIRQAVLELIPEDGEHIILTEKDMNIKENIDE